MDTKINIKKTQEVLLNMGIKIADIMEKNNIPYMLAFGTLLGAVRHKGFIPWDDDFDFYLFDDTYDDAIKILRSELPSTMFLEDENSEPLYFHSWAHVKDMNSIAINSEFIQDGLYSHKGISIDLYRTKRMKLSCLNKFLNDENYLYIKRRKEKGLIEEPEYNRRMERLKENRKYELMIESDEDYEVFNLVPYYKRHFLKASDVLPLKQYNFEGRLFWGPYNAEEVLRGIYGDYLTLPPVEQRRCHYSYVEFINEVKA